MRGSGPGIRRNGPRLRDCPLHHLPAGVHEESLRRLARLCQDLRWRRWRVGESQALCLPAARLALECDAFFRPTPQLAVAQRWVLGQIEAHVPRGSAVLDLGCGTGRFLGVLSRRSYRGIGIDPAEPVVSALRSLGYDAHVGSVPGLRWDGTIPAVIVLFEVLEHLVDPLAVLHELRTLFPAAHVGASVPSPFRAGLKRGRGRTDYPPNHFLRWTPFALQRAFERAGYRRSRLRFLLPPEAKSWLERATCCRSPCSAGWPVRDPRSRAISPPRPTDHPPCSEESSRPRRCWRTDPGVCSPPWPAPRAPA